MNRLTYPHGQSNYLRFQMVSADFPEFVQSAFEYMVFDMCTESFHSGQVKTLQPSQIKKINFMS